MTQSKRCPRCRKATTLLTVFGVCKWCFEGVVHRGERDRLNGYGYDLTSIAANRGRGDC